MKVITQTTAERKQETHNLFMKCKPYLDKGYGLYSAVRLCFDGRVVNAQSGWYRELTEYAKQQGYTKLRSGKKVHVEDAIRIVHETDEQQTEDLYHEVKPYLDGGECLGNAIRKVKGFDKQYNFYNQAWYKRLRLYVDSLEES